MNSSSAAFSPQKYIVALCVGALGGLLLVQIDPFSGPSSTALTLAPNAVRPTIQTQGPGTMPGSVRRLNPTFGIPADSTPERTALEADASHTPAFVPWTQGTTVTGATSGAILAIVAFFGGALAGRLWGRRDDVAAASVTGYKDGLFNDKLGHSHKRLEPLYGRRSAKIAATKGRADAKKAKLYARYGKKIIMAVKAGGPDEGANTTLRDVIKEAKDANVPIANIDRAIKRGSENDAADFKESLFEAYGKGGAGLMITVLSDNANRASSEVKSAINKSGLTVASPGSVAFNFERMGAIVCEEEVDEDLVLEAAMEADVDDAEVVQGDDGEWLVLTDPKQTTQLKAALMAQGVKCGESALIYHPNNYVELSEEDAEINDAAIERIEALDDVDSIAHNMA
jgi:YebC/PmpR family DNA-binding regulatory protein